MGNQDGCIFYQNFRNVQHRFCFEMSLWILTNSWGFVRSSRFELLAHLRELSLSVPRQNSRSPPAHGAAVSGSAE